MSRARFLVLLALSACAPPAARAPTPSVGIDVFEVRSKPLMVTSWTRTVERETHYSLVDEGGFIVEVVAEGADASECDHCAPHRAMARLLGSIRATEGSVVALGPTEAPLTAAKVLSHRDVSKWWNPANPSKEWAQDLAIDVDGDGQPDLVREAKGPQLSYRVRRLEKGAWVTLGEWTTAQILDVDDR
jgi:hypothetical protein